MNTCTRIFRSGLAATLSLLFWGCAGSSGSAPQFDPVSGHPPAAVYLSTHWSDYAQHPTACAACHGSITDPMNTTGGIAKVSCFTCHPNGPTHPKGWSAGLQHGRLGAEGAVNDGNGMASCAKCHGDDLKGGITAVSCTQCHTKAPHPNRPWISASLTQVSHTFTSFTNAPECFKCHAAGANFTGTPPPAPAPGTAPGCFNNTMCHGN